MREYKWEMPTYRIQIQTRQVREGGKLHFQYRSTKHFYKGGCEVGEWLTTGTITNYDEAMGFNKKTTFISRLFGVFTGG